MKTVLLVDEIPLLREYSKRLVTESIPETTFIMAQSASEALAKYPPEGAVSVVTDMVLPDMIGLKLAKLLWDRNDRIEIIFWTTSHKEMLVRELFRTAPRTAAYGYVLKTKYDNQLSYAIHNVFIHHKQYVDPIVQAEILSSRNPVPVLTKEEKETLYDALLGLTEKTIANRQGLSVRGVQHRLASIYKKLIERDSLGRAQDQLTRSNLRVRLILEAINHGLLTPAELSKLTHSQEMWFQPGTSQSTVVH